MNRRPSGLLLKKAINGFLQFKTAEGLSPSTLEHYRHILDLWMERQPDVDITKVTSKDIRDHLTYMRLEYTPRRITGGNDRKLSSKSIRNIYVAFSAFFRWAKDEFDIPSPMVNVPAPKSTSPEIIPLSKEEIERLLKVCDLCDEARTDQRRKFTMRRATARRDRAIILMLFDTGLRASELCSLSVEDVELKTGKVIIQHGVRGGAKGGKGRTVFLGKKTGVKKCYHHRFRHTFTIIYLRSGGDVFTLQMLLGHSSLDMVKRYARVAEIDAERAHYKASPADNWRL